MFFQDELEDEINIDVLVMTDIPPKPRTDEKSLQVNYYPIVCVESNRSIYGTVSYNFQGQTNQPNLIYKSPGETAPSGRHYCAKELFVLPNRESFEEFPFLGTCYGGGAIPESVDGALVIENLATTNSIDVIYTVFLLVNCSKDTYESQLSHRQIVPLYDCKEKGADGMKKWTQPEPHLLCMNDFLLKMDASIPRMFDIHLNQIDHHGKKCVVAIAPIMIPVPPINPPKILEKKQKEEILFMDSDFLKKEHQIENESTQLIEGFADSTSPNTNDITGDIGVDVGNLFKKTFTNNDIAGDKGVPMGSIRVPLQNDPNYTYQECTMVPVDDIDMQDTEYVYQIAGNSSIIANKTVTIQGNLLTYLIMYFIMFLLTFYGVPFVYAFLMCSLLKRGTSSTGFSGIIDYLKRPQNFLGLGKYSGITLIFNGFYFFAMLSTLSVGSLTVGVWMLIMWITGYVGIMSNPIPDSCMYT